ncbi:MAG: hypothetical protein LBM67_06910 [Lentimicrobiaceae bacterium]|nr:hypothetical protein [Lentimicrobiaceae bacterium]
MPRFQPQQQRPRQPQQQCRLPPGVALAYTKGWISTGKQAVILPHCHGVKKGAAQAAYRGGGAGSPAQTLRLPFFGYQSNKLLFFETDVVEIRCLLRKKTANRLQNNFIFLPAYESNCKAADPIRENVRILACVFCHDADFFSDLLRETFVARKRFFWRNSIDFCACHTT